ncbi:uncharacterized protein DS421_17g580940 [Arachis hypogaea]|nr:uncharacterized protein DS421_17g580940 [Arachis hypogaea]
MMDDAEIHFWGPLGVLGPTWCVLGLRFRAEVICGVERQFLCQFGRSTPVFDPFLALDARIGQRTGVERQFTSSILVQSMDYYILLESPRCLLSNAFRSMPFRVL